MNTQKNKVILHGECMVFPSEIPATAKAMNVKACLVVADSETTGNHHVVDALEGVKFFQDEMGTTFMKNSSPTQIRCVMTNRHNAITLEPGSWEFGLQQEYDYFTASHRVVRD